MFPWHRKGLRASAGAASQKIGHELEAFNALPRCYPRTRTKRGWALTKDRARTGSIDQAAGTSSPDLNEVRVQLIEMASRFLRLSPPSPDRRPNSSIAFRGPRRRVENVCHVQLQPFKFPAWLLGGLSIAHCEAQPGYDGGKPKIPMMFPGCIHGKEKD